MKKDREVLESNLFEVLEKLKKKRKSIENINKELASYGVTSGTLNEIIRGGTLLNTLDTDILCLISLSVFNETNDTSVSPHDFFTEREIEESKKYSDNQVKGNLNLPIKINNVTMVDLDNFITKIKISYLVELFHSQLIIYDFETQRSAKYKRGRDGVVPVPDVNKKSVEDISEHMLNGTYLADMITLNVYSSEVEALSYDVKSKSLIINDGATISILDGFHRLQAAVRAVSFNPDIELEMILSIRSYDTDTAKRYFGQINTINIVKTERLNELKSEKNADIVVRDLQMKPDLRGKIASSSNITEMANQLTTFDVLSYAIEYVYAPKTRLEAKEVSGYLSEFFDYLVGSYVDEFLINPNDYRDKYINHPLMFAGYIQIAKNFQDENKPLKDIKKYVDKINFNDPRLIEILDNRRGINNKRNRNKLIDYFK